jgi:hypothetical protein
MLTHEEALFYRRETDARKERLRAALRERGVPDWLETVCYAGRIFRNWRPVKIGNRRYALAACYLWDVNGYWGFRDGIVRFLSYPGKGFRTLREAEEAARQINAALPAADRQPLVEEVRLAFLEREQTAVHEARQYEISMRHKNTQAGKTPCPALAA